LLEVLLIFGVAKNIFRSYSAGPLRRDDHIERTIASTQPLTLQPTWCPHTANIAILLNKIPKHTSANRGANNAGGSNHNNFLQKKLILLKISQLERGCFSTPMILIENKLLFYTEVN
jgi:hypothetical protein